MRVRIWGRIYRVKVVCFQLKSWCGVRGAAKVRHQHQDILISILVPRQQRPAVIASAICYAWEHSPYAPVLAPILH